jgi:NTP pyrophosphatase (non-canonical NTP hydrolase)
MELSSYQRQALMTAIYPGKGTVMGLAYAGLGLGEAGEAQNKIKKVIRDDGGVLSDEKRLAIAKEIGGVLWYCAAVAEEIGMNLDTIAKNNLAELASRKARGVLSGSGDDR